MSVPTRVHDVALADGAHVYCEVYGAGEPLLLLHGGAGAGVNWKLIFDFESLTGHQFIVPDLRGHGRSTNPSGRISFGQLGEDVVALLDQLAIDQASMIGVSMGAKTLLHVATRHPNRVRRMVLVSAAPYLPEATRDAMRRAAATPKTDADWEMMRRWHVRGDDQILALWQMSASFADDYEDLSFTAPRLGCIAAPTLIVHGDRDWLYPTSLAVELHSGIANSHLWVIPNGGHGPIFGKMARPFAQTALEFLTGAWGQ